jgi:hypothetical protein
MEKPSESPRLHEFFLTMTRRSFAELGVGDTEVVGYVAALMTDFTRADRLYAMRQASGATDSVVQMRLTTCERPRDPGALERTRALRKYVADYALFMSGLFRTHVERRGALGYYMQEGQRSYWAVSELDVTLYRTGFLFFQELSKNFEFYSGALDYMRKAYFAPQPGGDSPFATFLRQVEGWITDGLSDN